MALAVMATLGFILSNVFFPIARYNTWKRAITVQALQGSGINAMSAESDSDNSSATFLPMSIMFLDQVDAHI